MAVSGLLCTWCLLSGLQNLEAIIFFPLRSIFSIIFTTAIAVLLWKEKLKWAGVAGLVMAAVAIGCLSVA